MKSAHGQFTNCPPPSSAICNQRSERFFSLRANRSTETMRAICVSIPTAVQSTAVQSRPYRVCHHVPGTLYSLYIQQCRYSSSTCVRGGQNPIAAAWRACYGGPRRRVCWHAYIHMIPASFYSVIISVCTFLRIHTYGSGTGTADSSSSISVCSFVVYYMLYLQKVVFVSYILEYSRKYCSRCSASRGLTCLLIVCITLLLQMKQQSKCRYCDVILYIRLLL